MLEGGYIKLYRSLLTWEWYGDVHTKALFLHLLLTANYQRRGWRGITVERGQRVASFTGLARETGLSVQNVKTAVAHLQSTGEVTYRSTRQYSVFTVEQYDRYQGSQPTDQPADQPAARPPSTSMEERKKEKEEKKEKETKGLSSFSSSKGMEQRKGGRASARGKPSYDIEELEELSHFDLPDELMECFRQRDGPAGAGPPGDPCADGL